MNAFDFEYDGQLASGWGLILCQLDGDSGINISTAGSELNFNQVSTRRGALWFTTETTYDSVLTATFQVCKYDCETGSPQSLTVDEQRGITRWLNRKEPHELKIISDENLYDYVRFEGSFNLSKVETIEGIIGFELTFTSNRPFALGKRVRRKLTLTAKESYSITDISDEIGYSYPDMTVTLKSGGDFTLYNAIEDRTTEVKSCTSGEVLTFDEYLNISSSLPSHKLQNDFNYVFFRVANTYGNRVNEITSSLDCEIILEYDPIIKGVSL